ncbi:hypothetical protein [Planosporangium mesophilum]|uniref:hypothetical protein n=1 Tax=Planosporangium mesophilum TaxID=689768 RepID=UPI0019511B5D|nr:hypothetical protein [Planosporangium mesophilum]
MSGRIAGHAYPWDVLGDPDFVGRVREIGVDTVTLAAAYHSTRAATPLHPAHQVVTADHAALYRPVREEAWRGSRLAPLGPRWMAEPDPFATAAASLRAAGLTVAAWIVLTHNTRLGAANPDLAVVNCFGDAYPYALCPTHEEVRGYAATLAAEALRGVPVDEVSVEACGQLGLTHLTHHEKTDGAWTPYAQRLLSVCCCAACRAGWRERGLDPDRVVCGLRAAVHADALGEPSDVDDLDEVLAARHAATDALRARVLARVREEAPGAPVTLHAHPDPWVTGASPGLTPTAAADVDAVLVPCWSPQPATADLVARAASAGRPVDAYVTVLPPADPDDLPAHLDRLRAAGASRLSLYHLGLAPAWRLPDLRGMVETWRSP